VHDKISTKYIINSDVAWFKSDSIEIRDLNFLSPMFANNINWDIFTINPKEDNYLCCLGFITPMVGKLSVPLARHEWGMALLFNMA
jgi:hypothetical protein